MYLLARSAYQAVVKCHDEGGLNKSLYVLFYLMAYVCDKCPIDTVRIVHSRALWEFFNLFSLSCRSAGCFVL